MAWLPLREVRSAGTVNAIFRIGDTLAARFPLRMEDVDEARALLAAEAVAARELRSASAVPTPDPVALGEPDLVGAWHLLDAEPRERLRQCLGCGEVEWARGMAWALQQAMGRSGTTSARTRP